VSKHPARRIRDPATGYSVDIDDEIVPLIQALWAGGYETIGSCQDLGESTARAPGYGTRWGGYVLVEMPISDACRLLDTVKVTPQFEDRMHWAAPGAWVISVPILPSGFSGDDAELGPWAQIRFPKDQVDDLVKVLT
jgi:hypothetical protein